MRRFFLEDLTAESAEARLRGHELRHLKVLRLKQGDEVLLFNGKGLEARGRIESLGPGEARLTIISTTHSHGESPLEIILMAGLPKAGKPDLVVQKATELGVSSIVFYSAGRSVPLVRGASLEKKLERWSRIALEASKQCGRTAVPAIAFEPGLTEAIAGAASAGVKLFFYEGQGRPTAEILRGHRGSPPRSVAILIGPEGGFTEAERGLALQAGYIAASLGPRTLRAETAAIVSVAIVQNLLGDF